MQSTGRPGELRLQTIPDFVSMRWTAGRESIRRGMQGKRPLIRKRYSVCSPNWTESRTRNVRHDLWRIDEDGQRLDIEESCEGKIGYAPAGENGFGFDPIFLVGEKSFSELDDAEKDAISHRGKALRTLAAYLEKQG